jgi:hypothetical protein
VNRAHAHCKHVICVHEDNITLPMCRGPECRSFTTTPFKVELQYQFHIYCTFYFLCLFCCICISDTWLFIKRQFFITVMSTVEHAASSVPTHQQWCLLYSKQSGNKKNYVYCIVLYCIVLYCSTVYEVWGFCGQWIFGFRFNPLRRDSM